MFTVYDVQVELDRAASIADVVRLKNRFKALSIDSVGLDATDYRSRTEELSFSIYGELGPFMMKRMVEECTDNIFPGAVVEVSERRPS